ncbi:MAG: hypothetical protein PVH03_04465 [Chloroflexota bacterium]
MFIKHANAQGNVGRDIYPVHSYISSLPADPHPVEPLESEADSDPVSVVDRSPSIQATYRISIPYGFDTPLPVLADGREVVASGHGACTAGEQVTVAITVTQTTSGAVATGENQHTCTGQLQNWSSVVTVDTTSSLTAGPAEACGFATARDGMDITDTFEWCKDVDLIELNQRVHLPAIIKP